ncbi:SixA phosphatase family protein [Adhaeribacter terreus]|uniref:SixA phosphatase family protein n=1 Tax=Adhaeribacter terreus TaxID=529703 RepID=A0ABW0E7H0_9BACT
MKKTLIIVRHAHTQDPIPCQEDHDRELTPEGRIAAIKSAEWLKEQGITPKKIVASSAKRTQATAAALANGLLGNSGRFEAENILFRASETDLLDFIHENFRQEDTILIVGHNPTVTQFSIRLGATSISYLPPASAVILSFEIENWADLHFHSGKLVAKNLTEEA